MGRKKKPEWQMSEDMRIVFECSPNLMPCKKFLHANSYRFADHMKNDKCQQCIAWFEQTDIKDFGECAFYSYKRPPSTVVPLWYHNMHKVLPRKPQET